MNKVLQRSILATSILLTIPSVAARPLDLGIGSGGIGGAVGMILETIASIFSFNVSPTTLVGLMKFCFFLMIFAIMFWLGRKSVWKGDDGSGVNKRTAGIVAFTTALITVLFIPKQMFLNLSSIIPAMFTLIILLIPAIAAIAAAFFIFTPKEGEKGAAKHFVGAILIATAWGITTFMFDNAINYGAEGIYTQILVKTMSWVLLVMPLLLLVKIFQGLFASVGASGDGKGGDGSFLDDLSKGLDNVSKFVERHGRGRLPQQVQDVQVKHDNGYLVVTWKKNPEPNITRYVVEYRVNGGGWRKLGINGNQINPNLNEAKQGPPDPVPAIGSMVQARVKAINELSYEGYWGLSIETKFGSISPKAPDFGPQLAKIEAEIRTLIGMGVDHKGNQHMMPLGALAKGFIEAESLKVYKSEENSEEILKEPTKYNGDAIELKKAILIVRKNIIDIEKEIKGLHSNDEFKNASSSQQRKLLYLQIQLGQIVLHHHQLSKLYIYATHSDE